MGGSKQTQTTQTTSQPWQPAQPALMDILSKAGQYANDTSMFTPTFSANTTQGLNNIADWAKSPLASIEALRPLIAQSGTGANTAFNTLNDVASGKFLNANPYLNQVLADASKNTANTVNQQFSAAGRYGSGAHTGVLADKLGQMETQARYQNYQDERNNQNAAANTLMQSGWLGANAANNLDQNALNQQQVLFGAGQMKDQMDMALKQSPLAALEWLKGTAIPIAGLGGQSNSTGTVTQQPNKTGMIAGGIMTGLGLLTGNPLLMMGGMGGVGGGLAR